MKIAHKIFCGALIGLGSLCASSVFAQMLAQDAAVAGIAGMAAAEASQQGVAVPPSANAVEMPKTMSSESQSIALPGASSSPTIMPPALDVGKGKDGDGEMKSPKMPESVKSVVK